MHTAPICGDQIYNMLGGINSEVIGGTVLNGGGNTNTRIKQHDRHLKVLNDIHSIDNAFQVHIWIAAKVGIYSTNTIVQVTL